MESKTINEITVTDFKELLNKSFEILFDSESMLEAELIEVLELKNSQMINREPFSLTFRTSQKNEYYQQGNYLIKYKNKLEMPLFMVPIGPDAKGMRYEAIFS
jgi:hypothetical protein